MLLRIDFDVPLTPARGMADAGAPRSSRAHHPAHPRARRPGGADLASGRPRGPAAPGAVARAGGRLPGRAAGAGGGAGRRAGRRRRPQGGRRSAPRRRGAAGEPALFARRGGQRRALRAHPRQLRATSTSTTPSRSATAPTPRSPVCPATSPSAGWASTSSRRWPRWDRLLGDGRAALRGGDGRRPPGRAGGRAREPARSRRRLLLRRRGGQHLPEARAAARSAARCSRTIGWPGRAPSSTKARRAT